MMKGMGIKRVYAAMHALTAGGNLGGIALQAAMMDIATSYKSRGHGGGHRPKCAFKKGNASHNRTPHQGVGEALRRSAQIVNPTPARKWTLMIGDMVIVPELANRKRSAPKRLLNKCRQPNPQRVVLL